MKGGVLGLTGVLIVGGHDGGPTSHSLINSGYAPDAKARHHVLSPASPLIDPFLSTLLVNNKYS